MNTVAARALGQGVRRGGLVAALVFAASSAGAQPAGAFRVRDGVVADPARGLLYVAEPGGGLSAVRLDTGSTAWTSADAAVPLAVRGGVLLGQAEDPDPGPRLRLVLLDLEASGRTLRETALDLPQGVRAWVTDRKGESFRASAEPSGSGFLVQWNWRELRAAKGMAPNPEDTTLVRIESGAARVGPDGRVSPAPGDPEAARRVIPPAPWSVGSVIAHFEGARDEALVLKRRHAVTGAPLPDRVLLTRAVVALPAADQSALVGIERVGEGGPDDPEYRWSIFSLETGEKLGDFRRDRSATPFFLWNGRVFFESPPHGFRTGEEWVDEPLEIHGARLDGVVSWEREIRDLAYRGVMPPAR